MVSVVNPARIKRYGESKLHRNKTDKADAFLIAEFCLKEKPPFWKPLSPEMKHLRAGTSFERSTDQFPAGTQPVDFREKDPWVLEDLQVILNILRSASKTAKAIQQFIARQPGPQEQQQTY